MILFFFAESVFTIIGTEHRVSITDFRIERGWSDGKKAGSESRKRIRCSDDLGNNLHSYKTAAEEFYHE